LKHPTLKIHEIRKALLIPIYSHGITQTLRDSMYHIQQDALAIGPRCEKKGVTRSLCDLYWYLNGQRQEETTKHILFDCPHAASVLNAHRAFILATASPPGVANAQSMDRASFIKKFARRIVFGSTIGEDQMYHAPPSVLAHFTAAVHQTAIARRKRNSTQGIHAPPLSFDPDTFLSACMALFARSAKSTHFLAEREENRLQIQYYNWTPKLSPLDKWQHDWIASGVFEEGANSSRHALRSSQPLSNNS